MLVAAFLAGSFFPFSSEAVMLALLAAGLDPWQLVVSLAQCSIMVLATLVVLTGLNAISM